jgi:uncharacterized membrane protein
VNRKPLLVVLLAACAYIGLFTVMQFRLYDAFRMGLRDLAFFQQSFESALHGKPFLIRQGYPADTAVSHLFYNGWDERSLFSEHLYLFSILFLPLYAVFRTPYLFLVLNAVGVGLTAVPLFLLAKQWLRSEWLAVVVACAFLLHPAVQVATLGDYIYGMHPDDFMPLLMLGAFVCATRLRPRAFWLLSLLALATVESVAPTVAALGLYMSFSVPHWRRHSIALAVVAILYFGIATLVIIPLAGGGRAT